MADFETKDCMLCGERFVGRDVPENLAFMAHIRREAACRDEFGAWRAHMSSDCKGD